MPPFIARLAGFGAFSAIAGFAALYALFLYITRPSGSAGLDGTQRFLCWFTVAGVLLALALVHVVIGRQLLTIARNESRSV